MKMILPIKNFIGNYKSEDFVWKKFNELLPDEFVSFHNYNIGIKEADVIMLVPGCGVLIIEIKGYLAKNIYDIPDNSIIRFKNKPIEGSPFKQAITYRNILINDFLKPNNVNSVYVTCAVCYPYITKDEYNAKGLNKISHERLTLTKEDLEKQDSLLNKIDDIFDLTYESISQQGLERYGFDMELMEKVGSIISPNFRNAFVGGDDEIEPEEDDGESEDEEANEDILERKMYSRLICLKESDVFDDENIDELVSQWKTGTKIYFYTPEESLLENVSGRIKAVLDKNKLEGKDFKFSDYKTLLFNAGLIPEPDCGFEIINGEGYEKFLNELTFLHKNSGFNNEQYQIEHAPLENIIIKAGAGTGKTYSIISRINYLVWKKNYNAEEMKKSIAMITFTNESADDMKEKLSNNFLNYYLLTRNISFLDYVESVENMNISTIHSMAKKVLQKYSAILGLGKDFKIVTGNFKRSQILHLNLNKLVESNPKIENEIDLSMYYLEKRLTSFLDKLDNKNVDIVSDYEKLNFGRPDNPVFSKMIGVLKDTQKGMNDYCQEQNSISLGDLIRKLRKLYNSMQVGGISDNDKVDFLFVDEFQDTDDVQINLIKSFKNVFGFKLFVVGDIKQCIYRFRGAEVKAFDTLMEGFKEPLITISLNKNYRTDVLLLNKLNNIFIGWDKKNDLEYRGNDILVGTKKYCVELELHKVAFNREEKIDRKLVTSVKDSKSKLKGENDKVAILVRYNWQVSEIRNICESNGINVETEIGGELFKIDPTIDLFKLILALKYNRSPKYLYNLFTTSYVLEDIPKTVLWSKDENEIVDYFYHNIPNSLKKWNEYISRLREEPVLKVIRDVVEDAKPWDKFARKINAKGNNIERSESYYIRNLDQLFENLIEASNTDFLTLNKVSEYLEIMILTKREEEARESYDLEKSNATVICTTIHKSKGLEFDTVILPYCDFDVSCAKTKGDVDLIYSKNEIGYRVIGNEYKTAFQNDLYKTFQRNEISDRKHEETRILYVALTRAIRKILFFSDETPDSKKPRECWANMIGEVQS